VILSTLPRDRNCAHQLANYWAHHPPASIKPGRIIPSPVVLRKLGIRLRLRSTTHLVVVLSTRRNCIFAPLRRPLAISSR
jgi:hypothetical protein